MISLTTALAYMLLAFIAGFVIAYFMVWYDALKVIDVYKEIVNNWEKNYRDLSDRYLEDGKTLQELNAWTKRQIQKINSWQLDR